MSQYGDSQTMTQIFNQHSNEKFQLGVYVQEMYLKCICTGDVSEIGVYVRDIISARIEGP